MNENEKFDTEQEAIAPQKSKKKHSAVWRIILALIIIIGLYVLYNMYQNTQLEKNFYQVQSDKVIGNVRVVCISDLHMKV